MNERLRKSNRGGQRGAAMPEASIIALFLVVFWGVMGLVYASGKAAMMAAADARSGVMYYALHECKRSLPNRSAGIAEQGRGASTRTPGGVGEGAPVGGGGLENRSAWMLAGGSATASTSIVGRTATKTSSSWAACNEGVYEGNLFGFFAYGLDFFKDLLPPPVRSLL